MHMTEYTDRVTAERALAGCMCLESAAIDAAISSGIDSKAITDADARAVIAAAMIRHAAALPTDVLTITTDSGIPWERIEAMIDAVPTVTHAAYYAERVTAYATLDRFRILGEWITRKATKAGPDDCAAIAAEIGAATDRAMQAGRLMVSGTLATAALEWLDRMTAAEEHATMLDWPVRSITKHMGRVDREYIWIVAQPSIGKTAFVLQWLICLAKQGHTVSMASLESAADAIGSRAIANIGPLDNYPIRQRRASADTVARAYDAARRIPDSIRITDSRMTVDQLYAWGKAEARRGSKLIVIDNTRHIHVRGNVDRVNEVAEISSRMKQLRDEARVPVVVLHHSMIDSKTGREDVSWSKDIRKDADVMCFLKHDPENSQPPQNERDPGLWAVKWCVEKNRESRAGYEILMRFRKEFQLFEEWGDNVDNGNEKEGDYYE
jgi:replicative DNA helicase